jgi:hypothetical protein
MTIRRDSPGAPLLHIGLPKTGTTTIQQALFARHSQVYYLGKDRARFIHPKGCTTGETYIILRPLLWDLATSVDHERVNSLYTRHLLPNVAAEKVITGSWEALGLRTAEDNVEMMQRVLRVFGGCRIMITLRNPLTQITSHYLQHLQGHFIKQNRGFMGRSVFLEFDEWYKRRLARWGMFCYSETIRAARTLLGKEHVGVFLFEELIEDSSRYYRNLCAFLGINAEEALTLVSERHLNKRISQDQVQWLKKMNASFWKRTALLNMNSRWRKRLFQKHENMSAPAKVSIPSTIALQIADKTRPGHRWLAEHFALPLDRYGYPL